MFTRRDFSDQARSAPDCLPRSSATPATRRQLPFFQAFSHIVAVVSSLLLLSQQAWRHSAGFRQRCRRRFTRRQRFQV